MLHTVQVDVSDTALNHHRYGLSRILSDGGKPSVLGAGKKQKIYSSSHARRALEVH